MKHLSTIAALSVFATGLCAAADEQQAFLGVFVETTQMKMAGVAMPKIPDLPPGVNLPPQVLAKLKGFGAPQRKLTVRLWSPGIAPEGATAALSVPDGLKLGEKLDLDLFRPKPEEAGATGGPAGAPGSIDPEFVIKRYWGSSETVKPGQPEVIEFKGLNNEQKAMMREKTAQARNQGSYYYKPNWTTGYWPTQNQAGAVDPAAVLTGHYALTSSYTGNVEIDVPANVNFLDPIEMTSPQLEQIVPLDKAILFRWKNVPNALGFHASITGIMGKKTIIMWSSSEVRTDVGMATDYLQMSEVKDFVQKTVFMPGDRVEVAVPAGIFDGCDIVSMQMVGYGPGTALDKGQPLPRVQAKTSLMITLGGKMMANRRGFGRPGADPNAGQ